MDNFISILNNIYISFYSFILNYKILIYSKDITILKPIFLIITIMIIYKMILSLLSRFIYNFPLINIIIEMPGTIIHELSHAFIAFITFSKIHEIKIFPEIKKTNEGINIKYGYVSFTPKFNISQIFISTAPLYMNTLLIIIIYNFFDLNLEKTMEFNFLNLILVYLTSIIISSSILSIQDIKGFFNGFKNYYIYILLLLYIIFFDKINIFIIKGLENILIILNEYLIIFINSNIFLLIILIYLLIIKRK